MLKLSSHSQEFKDKKRQKIADVYRVDEIEAIAILITNHIQNNKFLLPENNNNSILASLGGDKATSFYQESINTITTNNSSSRYNSILTKLFLSPFSDDKFNIRRTSQSTINKINATMSGGSVVCVLKFDNINNTREIQSGVFIYDKDFIGQYICYILCRI